MTVENASLISLASHWPNKKFQGIGEETCLRRFLSSPPGASDPPPGRPHRHGLPTHTYRDGSLEIGNDAIGNENPLGCFEAANARHVNPSN
jgi:hypothetical protein